MHQFDPTVCMPYWDSTLDSYCPDPSTSMLWSAQYMGTSYGRVITGFAANWTRVVPSACSSMCPTLYRECGNDATLMITDAKISHFLNFTSYSACTSPIDIYWEQCHGDVHIFVGGHMSDLRCAPNDPVFYMHHCFLDLLWEQYRAKHPNSPYPNTKVKYNKVTDYLLPWQDGTTINDLYTNNVIASTVYSYADRPKYCTSNAACKSKVLWCDVLKSRCKAGIAEGGDCTGLPNDACCSLCVDGTHAVCGANNKCACPTPCLSDSDCLPTQCCDLNQSRCAAQLPLGSACNNANIPNNACYGDCPVTDAQPIDPGYTRMPLCYQGYCQCCDLTYDN